MNQNFRVNKPNFHMKGFALGLALKQRRKATRKLSIKVSFIFILLSELVNIENVLWKPVNALKSKRERTVFISPNFGSN